MGGPCQMDGIKLQVVHDFVGNNPPAGLGDHGVGGHLEGHRVPHIIGDFVATQIPNNLLCQFYLPARHISGTTIATSLLPKDSHRRR